MPDTDVLRRFLATTTADTVEIETADLLALCEAAERAIAAPPRVPALLAQSTGAAA